MRIYLALVNARYLTIVFGDNCYAFCYRTLTEEQVIEVFGWMNQQTNGRT